MMRMPIKVASDVLPRCCSKIIPTVANPGVLIWGDCTVRADSGTDMRAWFSKHVSGLTSGATWKSTTPHRHKLADKTCIDLCRGLRPVIIDIGVSDGVTSLELIEKLAGFIEEQNLWIPPNNILIDELESFGYELSDSGNIKYSAPQGLHDDCVDSLALAIYPLHQQQKTKNILISKSAPRQIKNFQYY